MAKFKDGVPFDYEATYGKTFFRGLMAPQEADADDLSGETAFKGQRYRVESSGQRGVITVRLPEGEHVRGLPLGAEVRLVNPVPRGWATRTGNQINPQMTHGAEDIVLVNGPSGKPDNKSSDSSQGQSQSGRPPGQRQGGKPSGQGQQPPPKSE